MPEISETQPPQKKHKTRARRDIPPEAIRAAIAEIPQPSKEQIAQAKKDMQAARSMLAKSVGITRAKHGWEVIFLDTLRKIPNVALAARAAGVARQTAMEKRNRDPKFAAQWEQACAEGVDVFEGSTWALAQHGSEQPIWMKDENGKPTLVGHRKEYYPQLNLGILRAYKSHLYAPKVQQEISGPGGAPLSLGPTVNTQVVIQIPSNGRGDPAHAALAELEVQAKQVVDSTIQPDAASPNPDENP